MITENEVPTVLAEKIPEMKNELEKNKFNIFKVFNCFKSYTIKCAELGKISKLRSCFVIAEKLLRKGNEGVKSAMEYVKFSPTADTTLPTGDWVSFIITKRTSGCLHLRDFGLLVGR